MPEPDVIRLNATPQDLMRQVQQQAGARDEHAPGHADPDEAGGVREQLLKARVIEALSGIYDPEIPVNIYELGLIYDIEVDAANNVDIKMTLTSPGCPVAGTLPPEVEMKVSAVPGVNSAQVELVWEPPYNMEMMSEAARLQLGLM